MRITVDRDRCIGSGNCSFYAPATFGLDDDLKVVVLGVGVDLESDVRAAAEGCPVRAITVEPGDGDGDSRAAGAATEGR